MDAWILGGTLILSVLFYGWFVFIWLAGTIANIIDIPFSKPNDDEVVSLEGEAIPGQVVTIREVTRGDRRIRLIMVLIVLPILVGLHYVYWEPFYAGAAWLFEEVIGPTIAMLLELLEE